MENILTSGVAALILVVLSLAGTAIAKYLEQKAVRRDLLLKQSFEHTKYHIDTLLAYKGNNSVKIDPTWINQISFLEYYF